MLECGSWAKLALLTKHLFGPLQLAGPRSNAQALEERYIELGVHTPSKIPASLGDSALTFQYSEVLRANSEPP